MEIWRVRHQHGRCVVRQCIQLHCTYHNDSDETDGKDKSSVASSEGPAPESTDDNGEESKPFESAKESGSDTKAESTPSGSEESTPADKEPEKEPEKDPVLAARLKESLGLPEKLEVVSGDALKFIATGGADAEYDAMISNLPYQAGTRILLDLVIAHKIPSMTVLVQTEVAERLAAKEGSKIRSLSGVWAQLDYDVKVLRKLPPSCFWPRPQICSSVVRLVRHARNASMTLEERKLFHSLTKRAFEHRRKQLGSIFKDLIQSTARAEELSNEDWITLVKGLTNENA